MSSFFHRHQKTIVWAIVIGFFIGGVGLFSANQAGLFSRRQTAPSDLPQYAAKVNGSEISIESLNDAIQETLNTYSNYYRQLGQDFGQVLAGASGALYILQLQSNTLDTLIYRQLFYQEANNRGVNVTNSEVTAQAESDYADLLAANNVTEEQLVTYLTQVGSTLTEFKAGLEQDAERQILVDRLRAVVIGSVEPTADEVRAYYEEDPERYAIPEEVRASHILVSDPELAASLRSSLIDGAAFDELARVYSEDAGSRDAGGDLGWFGRATMVPEFEEAAFALEIGEISEPVETDFGFHIIKVVDRHNARTPEFAEVEEDIRNDLTAEREAEAWNAWTEQAYEAADIEIAYPVLNAYRMQQTDIDLGLAEFERVLDEGEAADPYLPYYIGRAYESKAATLTAERSGLEAKEEPTDEDLARIAELTTQVEQLEGQALDAYLEALNDVEADEAFLTRILKLNPDSVTAIYLLGKLYADRGDSVAAEDQFSSIIEKDPTYVAAYKASGELAEQTGNLNLAKLRYEQALEQRPTDAGTKLKLAGVFIALGDLDAAEARIAEAGEVDSGSVNVKIAEGDLAVARLEEAVAERDTLQAMTARSDAQESRLVELDELTEDLFSTAEERYLAGLQASGGLDLNIKLGWAYLLYGDLNKAEREFQMVITRSPYRADAYEGLAMTLVAMGEIEEALENLQLALSRSFDDVEQEGIALQIIDLDPDDADTRMQLALIYVDRARWDLAIPQYAAVLSLNPTSYQAYIGIAEAYAWRNDVASAVEYLQRGVEEIEYASERISLLETIVETVTDPANPDVLPATGMDALIALAQIQTERGELGEALAALAQVKASDPSYRRDEVNTLIIDAGGIVPEPVVDESSTQTESETVDSEEIVEPNESEDAPTAEPTGDEG